MLKRGHKNSNSLPSYTNTAACPQQNKHPANIDDVAPAAAQETSGLTLNKSNLEHIMLQLGSAQVKQSADLQLGMQLAASDTLCLIPDQIMYSGSIQSAAEDVPCCCAPAAPCAPAHWSPTIPGAATEAAGACCCCCQLSKNCCCCCCCCS
jgi:hypothetical protein